MNKSLAKKRILRLKTKFGKQTNANFTFGAKFILEFYDRSQPFAKVVKKKS